MNKTMFALGVSTIFASASFHTWEGLMQHSKPDLEPLGPDPDPLDFHKRVLGHNAVVVPIEENHLLETKLDYSELGRSFERAFDTSDYFCDPELDASHVDRTLRGLADSAEDRGPVRRIYAVNREFYDEYIKAVKRDA